jgi:hypothetical protein
MCSNKPTGNALIVSIVSQLELPETIVPDLFRKLSAMHGQSSADQYPSR